MVGLAVLLTIDATLVAVAFGTNNAPKSDATSAAFAASSSAARPDSTVQTATPKQVATSSPPAAITAPTRLLAAFDSSTLWRTEIGSCPGEQVAPELSTDGGETWATAAESGAAAILAVNALSGVEASMITLAAVDCRPELVTTFVAGDQWATYPDRLDSNWYVIPTDRAVVHSPAGSFVAPCENVVVLAARSDEAAGVLCDDGSFVRTNAAGASWGAAVAMPGVLNLTASAGGYILAAAERDGCGGIQVLNTSERNDGSIVAIGCVESESLSNDVAIESKGEDVWLWGGSEMRSSVDGGATW